MTAVAAIAIAVLLVASGVFTAAASAVFRIGSSRLRTLGEEGFKGSDALASVREAEIEIRTTVRLTTRVLNFSALGLAFATQSPLSGAGGPVAGMVQVIIVVLIVADLIPNLVAARQPVRLALTLAPVLLLLTRATRWFIAPIRRLETRLAAGSEPSLTSEQRELRELQEIGASQGVLEPSENLMVERAFRLDELTAWDVMVPRVDIFAWKGGLALSEIVEELGSVPFSRVPVYGESVDDIKGIVYVREVYERYANGEEATRLSELAREPFFVPGSLPLTQLLRDFQHKRIHMGIVADEFGGTDGLVTLEDVLEELVGEIHDETDVQEDEIVRVSDGVVDCDAGADLRDLNEALGVALPSLEHRSLNGFILEETGQVPTEGETLEREGVRIDILEATETQVLRARLTRLADAGHESGGPS